MADTTKIKRIIEPYIQNWLTTIYPDHVFEEKPVTLVTGGTFKFDAVSEDGSVIGMILCNRPKTRTGNENTGAVRKALGDISYLKLLPEKVSKVMVFTDSNYLALVNRRAARMGIESITMIVCPLPPDLRVLLDGILNSASNEQRAAE